MKKILLFNIMTIKQFMDYYEKNLETELIEFCEKYIDLDKILTQEQAKKMDIILKRNIIRKEKNLNVWKKDLKRFIFSLTNSLIMETE